MRNQIALNQKATQLTKLLKPIVELLFQAKLLKEDFQKTEETDIELPNTQENGLDVWQDITIGLI